MERHSGTPSSISPRQQPRMDGQQSLFCPMLTGPSPLAPGQSQSPDYIIHTWLIEIRQVPFCDIQNMNKVVEGFGAGEDFQEQSNHHTMFKLFLFYTNMSKCNISLSTKSKFSS